MNAEWYRKTIANRAIKARNFGWPGGLWCIAELLAQRKKAVRRPPFEIFYAARITGADAEGSAASGLPARAWQHQTEPESAWR